MFSVEKTLSEIKSLNKPTIIVFNKIDNYKYESIDEDDLITNKTKSHYTLDDWKRTWMNKLGNDVLFVSAKNKENIDSLKDLLYTKVRDVHVTRFPYNNFLYPESI
jgi:GTP-binding protein HflX